MGREEALPGVNRVLGEKPGRDSATAFPGFPGKYDG